MTVKMSGCLTSSVTVIIVGAFSTPLVHKSWRILIKEHFLSGYLLVAETYLTEYKTVSVIASESVTGTLVLQTPTGAKNI